MTHKNAIDVLYRCPMCQTQRAVTWLFPDVELEFVDECCNQKVVLEPKVVIA
jgi:hypothetical protein